MAMALVESESQAAVIRNCFPVRYNFGRTASDGYGAWTVAFHAEQKRRFHAVLCTKQTDDIQNKDQPKASITSPADATDTLGLDVKDKIKILDKLFLVQHCCIDDPRDLCSINICGQGLTDVNKDDLLLFDNVVYVTAGENILPFEALSSFLSLRELDVSLNGLRNLQVSKTHFQNLQVLDVSYNYLSGEDVLSLGYLCHLKVLHLTGNHLNKLPPDLAQPYVSGDKVKCQPRFPCLEVLLLDDNKLKDADVFAALASLPKLRHLDLSKNSITFVPQLKIVKGRVETQEGRERRNSRFSLSTRTQGRTAKSSACVKPKSEILINHDHGTLTLTSQDQKASTVTTQKQETTTITNQEQMASTITNPKQGTSTTTSQDIETSPSTNQDKVTYTLNSQDQGKLTLTNQDLGTSTLTIHEQWTSTLTNQDIGTLTLTNQEQDTSIENIQALDTLTFTNQIYETSTLSHTNLETSKLTNDHQGILTLTDQDQVTTPLTNQEPDNFSGMSSQLTQLDSGLKTAGVLQVSPEKAEDVMADDFISGDLTAHLTDDLQNYSSQASERPPPMPPFSELRYLNLSNNKICKEEALLAVAVWPVLKEVDIFQNPLTDNKSGDPPLLTEFLQGRLGIRLNRLKPTEISKTQRTNRVEIRPRYRKITEVVPKIPKLTAEEKMLLQLPSSQGPEAEHHTLSGPGINQTAKAHTKSDHKLQAGLSGQELSNGAKEDNEENFSHRGAQRNDLGVQFAPFFMTQPHESEEQSTAHKHHRNAISGRVQGMPSGSAHQPTSSPDTGRDGNLSSARTTEKHPRVRSTNDEMAADDRYRGFELLLKLDKEDNQAFVPPAKDIQSNIRALKFALSHLLVYRDPAVQLNRVQKLVQEYRRIPQPPPMPSKTHSETISQALTRLKNRSTSIEENLATVLQQEQKQKQFPEATKLLKRVQKLYSSVRRDIIADATQARDVADSVVQLLPPPKHR